MRTSRIYTAQALQSDTVLELEPEPSRHLARALRIKVGDHLILFDGLGGDYRATVTSVTKKSVQVKTGAHQATEYESSLDTHLGIAVSRGERMDWVIQKATELGVNALTPLLTERTAIKLSAERADKKRQHWQQVAISACEQCGRNRLPVIQPLQELGSWLQETRAERKFVLHHRTDTNPVTNESPESIALLVGPEGGLSEHEIQAAEAAGYCSLRLGPRVLRTETAPVAALAILQSFWGDMKPN